MQFVLVFIVTFAIGIPGKNGGVHPVLVHFGDYDGAWFVFTLQRYSFIVAKPRGLCPHHLLVSSRSSSLIHASRVRMDLCARAKSRGSFHLLNDGDFQDSFQITLYSIL